MTYPWWSLLPFVALLACIAVFPLVPALAHLWEKRLFQLAVALALGVPMALWVIARGNPSAVGHALVEYGQFITLLFALFVVSGGLFVSGDLPATPRTNTLFLGMGAVLASLVGTTGAAMLLIRPLLNTNRERTHISHTVIYAIFVVANCGGLLTPLGDPPLFLGMLRGVPFLWTLTLFGPWLVVNGLLLLSYYALDRKLYATEPPEALVRDQQAVTPLGLMGRRNLLLFAGVVATVALAPSVDLHAIESGHARAVDYVPWRELLLLALAGVSYFTGDRRARFEHNHFTFGPIQEVAALFVGIFLTMVPALGYLRQVAPSLPLNEVTLYLFTGSLSSVLDNAPTYATFFEMASQLPGEPRVAGVPELYLTAISLGAVLFGAMTYIGNGPNFMVKAVAEHRRVRMPSFAEYVARWSLPHLGPVFLVILLVFVVPSLVAKGGGLALAAGLVIHAVWRIRRHPLPRTAPAPAEPGSAA